jgi:uncharacterized protein with PIN domain
MTVKVIDASPLAALLFGEPEAAAVVGRLGDARLVAPSLLDFELANICLLKCRRHLEQGRCSHEPSACAAGSGWRRSP